MFSEQDSHIIVHTLTPSVGSQFVTCASFGGMGRVLLDDALTKMFAEIVGDDVLQRFVETKTLEWLDIKLYFKRRISEMKDSPRNKVRITLHNGLPDLYREMKGKSLEEAITLSKLADDVTIAGSHMCISSHVIKNLSDMLAAQVNLLLQTALGNLKKKQISTIFIIGEFTMGSYLQNIIRSSFADIRFVFRKAWENAVSQGAFIHAQDETDPECSFGL